MSPASDDKLTVKKGEVVALIGTNGSGKSTLLKLMTKIIFPNNGEIKILEQVRLKYNALGYKYECLIDGNIDYIYQ